MNNEDKACVVYNSKGQGDFISVKVGGLMKTSLDDRESEKLLGIHVSRDFNWKIHVEKLAVELNKKSGPYKKNEE